MLLSAGAVLLAAAIALPAIAFTRTMSPSSGPPANRSQRTRTPIGASITVVVMLGDRRPDGSFTAMLLEANGDQSYRATGSRLRVAFATDTQVTMGSLRDVTPGAVLQAQGVLTARDAISARRATVLTGLVRVTG